MKLDIDIKVIGDAETLDFLERRIEKALDEAADEFYDQAVAFARKRLEDEDAIFNGDVWRKWEKEEREKGNDLEVIIRNYSTHAAIVEYGAPGSRWSKRPPARVLRPWVRRKLAHWPETEDAKVIWLQEKIFNEGITGVHYARYAENRLKAVGPIIVETYLQKHLPRYI